MHYNKEKTRRGEDMEIGAILGIVSGCTILLIVAVFVWWYHATYQAIVSRKGNADEAFGELNVLLETRYRDVSDFVSVCQSYLDESTKSVLLATRNETMVSANIQERFHNERRLGIIIQKAINVCGQSEQEFTQNEAKSYQNMQKMQDFIDKNRQFYNSMATAYNQKLQTAPGRFWAKRKFLEPMCLYEM